MGKIMDESQEMPYGRYKGRPIRDVLENVKYLSGIIKNDRFRRLFPDIHEFLYTKYTELSSKVEVDWKQVEYLDTKSAEMDAHARSAFAKRFADDGDQMPFGKYAGFPIGIAVKDDDFMEYINAQQPHERLGPPELYEKIFKARQQWFENRPSPSSAPYPNLRFGKYSGYTIAEAYRRDPQYIAWLSSQPFLNTNPRIAAAISRIFTEGPPPEIKLPLNQRTEEPTVINVVFREQHAMDDYVDVATIIKQLEEWDVTQTPIIPRSVLEKALHQINNCLIPADEETIRRALHRAGLLFREPPDFREPPKERIDMTVELLAGNCITEAGLEDAIKRCLLEIRHFPWPVDILERADNDYRMKTAKTKLETALWRIELEAKRKGRGIGIDAVFVH